VIVLDAAALLAVLNKERGWDLVVREALDQDTTISAVNYAEVLQKASGLFSAERVDAVMGDLKITVSPFGRLDARLTSSLYRHRSGLSLADRVCLALARSLTSPLCTADRALGEWAIEFGVEFLPVR